MMLPDDAGYEENRVLLDADKGAADLLALVKEKRKVLQEELEELQRATSVPTAEELAFYADSEEEESGSRG